MKLFRAAVAEATGAFFLVLIGPGAAMVDARTGGRLGITGIALAFAFVVTAVVAALGGVSGAHINPAVTVTLWARGRIPVTTVLPHVAAQCTGAIAAALLLRVGLGDIAHVGATIPAIPVLPAFVAELLMSAAL